MTKVLLVGNGAREHAIAEALVNSNESCQVVCFGKALNPGIKALASNYEIGSLSDFAAISAFAESEAVDFAFIGPDNPIGEGLADYLLEHNQIKSVAPLKACAQLESSKTFARNLMHKYNIPGLPGYKEFTSADAEPIRQYLEGELGGNFVVKYDGLLGGKGVKVSGDHLHSVEEGVAYAQECLADSERVLIEEKMVGQEFSLLALSDGETLYHFPAIQDHKRAYNGDQGPNTGGMGTYSDAGGSLPFLVPADIKAAKAINQKVIEAVKTETGQPFVGILYGGFMVTANGVRVIEYNTRFGDPEAMNIINLLDDDFLKLCQAAIKGELKNYPEKAKSAATVCVYAVPEGYPTNPAKGAEISLQKTDCPAKVYFSSVDLLEETDTEYKLSMSGSRAVAFVGSGATINEARQQALAGLDLITGPIEYRTDIGSPEVIEAKVAMMDALRQS